MGRPFCSGALNPGTGTGFPRTKYGFGFCVSVSPDSSTDSLRFPSAGSGAGGPHLSVVSGEDGVEEKPLETDSGCERELLAVLARRGSPFFCRSIISSRY